MQEGKTALMEASRSGCLDVVKELLRAKADMDVQDEVSHLHESCISIY